MAKSQKKSKDPRASKQRRGLNEDSLARLTSRIDQNLSSNHHKRKNPPTDAGIKQQPKRQRNLDDGQSSKNKAQIDRDALLAEIKALGGDEDDLELINAVDSDDETYAKESTGPVDKSLQEELLALSKELGFANMEPEVASEPETESEEDVGEDEGEEDGHDDEGDEDEEVTELERSKGNKKPGAMLFEPQAEWHAYKLTKLPAPTIDQLGPFAGAVEALKAHAKALLESDASRYKTSVFASSSHKFLSTIMSSGTLTDKISALTLAVQESPVHNIRAFDALLNLASKKSRAQAIGAIGALVDLLGPGALLPSERRLRPFHAQPGLLGTLQKHSVKSWSNGQPLPGKVTEEHLISWAYEDWLKETYFRIIQLLETWCSDEIEYSRMKAVDFVYGLLKEKPEQESNLLTLLVNKLGDRDRKIASRASYLLLQLQVSHPGMKPIIVRTIERDILLHPSQDHRSKYYAINTLNQTILSSREPAVAENLVRIYFDLFVVMLKSGSLGIPLEKSSGDGKGASRADNKQKRKSKTKQSSVPETEAADKLVSALLTGVNRAAPFVGTDDAIMEKHLDTLFRIAHSANFNTGLQALLLIQHLAAARNLAADRFYRTLYESLLDPRLVTSSKHALYLNLLLRALKNDVDVRRVKAFAKRMLQIASLHQPPFVCGLLYVLAHLRQTFPALATLVEEPETSVFDDDASAALPGYDGRKRDPEHCNAQRSCLWELVPFLAHFHPSVGVLATALLDKTTKVQKPDMESHTLVRFLDKFVYRNPKTTDSARGASIMQPLRAAKDLGDIWLGSKGAGATSSPVNSAAFWNKKAEDVAAEDVFFHEYFHHAGKEPKPRTRKDKGKDAEEDDDDAAGGEEGEDEIWKALVSTQPDIEDDGSEDGFDDLDDLDMASDDGSASALSLGSELEDDEEEEDDEDGGAVLSDDDGAGSDGFVAVSGKQGDEGSKDERSKKKARRKALKELPMFASVDDYAELLAGEEEADADQLPAQRRGETSETGSLAPRRPSLESGGAAPDDRPAVAAPVAQGLEPGRRRRSRQGQRPVRANSRVRRSSHAAPGAPRGRAGRGQAAPTRRAGPRQGPPGGALRAGVVRRGSVRVVARPEQPRHGVLLGRREPGALRAGRRRGRGRRAGAAGRAGHQRAPAGGGAPAARRARRGRRVAAAHEDAAGVPGAQPDGRRARRPRTRARPRVRVGRARRPVARVGGVCRRRPVRPPGPRARRLPGHHAGRGPRALLLRRPAARGRRHGQPDRRLPRAGARGELPGAAGRDDARRGPQGLGQGPHRVVARGGGGAGAVCRGHGAVCVAQVCGDAAQACLKGGKPGRAREMLA